MLSQGPHGQGLHSQARAGTREERNFLINHKGEFMKYYPIDEQPYIDLIRHAPIQDRFDNAVSYIDSIVDLFAKYGMTPGSGIHLINITKQGFRGWKKLVRYEIVVHEDDESEYFLDYQTYPDFLLKRFLDTAETEKTYYRIKTAMNKIYRRLGYEFTDFGTWKQYKGEQDETN